MLTSHCKYHTRIACVWMVAVSIPPPTAWFDPDWIWGGRGETTCLASLDWICYCLELKRRCIWLEISTHIERKNICDALFMNELVFKLCVLGRQRLSLYTLCWADKRHVFGLGNLHWWTSRWFRKTRKTRDHDPGISTHVGSLSQTWQREDDQDSVALNWNSR